MSDSDDQLPSTSPLFNSLIMTPVQYPFCFPSITPLYRTIIREGFDINAVAHAIATFLNDPLVNHLYIAGSAQSNAARFFIDLRHAIGNEVEVGFYCGLQQLLDSNKTKRVVLLVEYEGDLPTLACEHKGLNFMRNRIGYEPFTREHLASVVYNGNCHRGPIEYYECKSLTGFICVRRRYSHTKACGVCFWMPTKGRLIGPNYSRLRPEHDVVEFIDEGVVAEPLGVTEDLFRYYVSDTDISLHSDDGWDEDCDW